MTAAEPCNHPPEQRWQYRDTWKCCKCGEHFWGQKTDAKSEPLYVWQEGATLPQRLA